MEASSSLKGCTAPCCPPKQSRRKNRVSWKSNSLECCLRYVTQTPRRYSRESCAYLISWAPFAQLILQTTFIISEHENAVSVISCHVTCANSMQVEEELPATDPHVARCWVCWVLLACQHITITWFVTQASCFLFNFTIARKRAWLQSCVGFFHFKCILLLLNNCN